LLAGHAAAELLLLGLQLAEFVIGDALLGSECCEFTIAVADGAF
jgi:hypothetical protein